MTPRMTSRDVRVDDDQKEGHAKGVSGTPRCLEWYGSAKGKNGTGHWQEDRQAALKCRPGDETSI